MTLKEHLSSRDGLTEEELTMLYRAMACYVERLAMEVGEKSDVAHQIYLDDLKQDADELVTALELLELFSGQKS